MDCTGKPKRKRICAQYNINAIGCIVLYGGRTVISDAGGKVITDKYYKFHCVHKGDGHHEFIQCGYPTAKEICELCNIDLPSEFNPFANNGGGAGGGMGGGVNAVRPQNRGRKQLDNAIMLFITAKDDVLSPETAIFKVKERVEQDMYSDVEERDVKAVNTILGSFHTTIPKIIEEMGLHGAIRRFNFNILINLIDSKNIQPNNYR